MSQRVDITQYFTRRQSDLRYLRAPQTVLPPTSIALSGTGIITAGAEQFAYLDVLITGPDIPEWAALTVPQYIQGFQITYSYTISGTPISHDVFLAYQSSNIYRLAPVPAGVTVTLVARTVDYSGQLSVPSSSFSQAVAADTAAPVAPLITGGEVDNGALVIIQSVNGVPFVINSEPDFARYELWRGSGPTLGSITWEGSPLFAFYGGSAADVSVPADGRYYYRVAAVDVSGNRAYSNIVGPLDLSASGVGPPDAIDMTGSTATSDANGVMTVSFTPSSNPNLAAYRIWRKRRISTGPDVFEAQWTLVGQFSASPGTPNPTLFADINVVSGQRYRWTVTAVSNTGDESDYPTGFAEGTSADTSAPNAVSAITITGRVGGVQVLWTPSSSPDVIYYLLNWRLSNVSGHPGTGWQSQDIAVAGTTYPVLGLTSSRDDLANLFEVRLVAVDAIGNQSSITYYTATFPDLAGYRPADNTIPASPLTLTADASGKDGSVILSWPASQSPDRSGYQIEKYDSIAAVWEQVTTILNDAGGSIVYRILGLEPYEFRNKTYQFRVRTTDASGNISPNNLAVNSSFEDVTLSWTSVGGGGGVMTVGTTNPRTGLKALLANFASSPYQDVAISASQFYTLSAYLIQDPSSTGGKGRLQISWFLIDGVTPVGSPTIGPLITSTASHQRLEILAQAPGTAAFARISLVGDSSLPTKTIIWDDVQLEQGAGSSLYGDAKTGVVRIADVVAPADYTPITFAATPGLGKISLSWKNPAAGQPYSFEWVGATFEIWRKITNTGGQPGLSTDAVFRKIADVSAAADAASNSFDDLEPDESFHVTASYKLHARDRWGNSTSGGSSLDSNSTVSTTSLNFNDVPVVVIDTTPPTQPVMTSATISVQDDGSIKLTWNNQATFDLSGYNIWRRRNGLGETFLSVASIKAVPGGGTVSFVDSNPVQLQTYDYTVSAFDTQGNESTKDTVNFKTAQSTDTRTPGVPSSLKAKGAVASVVCSWLASSSIGVKEYDFQFSTDNGSSWSTSEIVTGVQKIVPFTNAEDLVSTGFLFRVKSYSTTRGASSAYVTLIGGDRDMTSYVQVDTTAPVAPTSLTPTLNDNSEVVLSWPASTSPDVNRYMIDTAFAVSIFLAVRLSNVVTITTNYSHALNVGDLVTLFEVADSSFNGTFTIVSVIDNKNFTFAQTAADATSASTVAGDNGFSQSPWQSYSTVPGSTLGLRVSGLQPFSLGGKLYIFRVFSVDNSNLISASSTSSNYVGVRLDTTPPGVPTSLTGNFLNEAGSVATASLSWDENPEIDIDHYDVSYMLASGDGLETVVSSPRGTPSTVIRGLRQSTAYNFKVRAVDRNSNRSDYGSVLNMTSNAPAGSAPAATDLSAVFYASSNILVDSYKLATRSSITAPTGVCGTAGVCRTSNVVTLKTSTAHGLLAGDTILVGGVAVSSFNGAFTVSTVPNSTTITYAQTAANANSGNGYVGKTYVRPGDFSSYSIKRSAAKIISSISRTSNVVTVNTTTAHGRLVGDTILVVSGSYSGTFTVVSVPLTTRLTYAQTAANASGPNTGRLYGEGSQIATTSLDAYTDTTVTQSATVIQYFAYSARVLNTSGLSSALSNLMEVTVPTSGSGGGGLDCPAAHMYVLPGIKAKNVVPGQWLDILVRTKLDIMAKGKVLSTRCSVQPCVLLQGENGASVVVSENTPCDDRDGNSFLAKEATGRWLATDIGNGIEWTLFQAIPAGEMEVAYIGMGGLTFAAGLDPTKRVFTHNANPGK
jgi:hypothetical protein